MRDSPTVVEPVAARYIAASVCDNSGESQISDRALLKFPNPLVWVNQSGLGVKLRTFRTIVAHTSILPRPDSHDHRKNYEKTFT